MSETTLPAPPALPLDGLALADRAGLASVAAAPAAGCLVLRARADCLGHLGTALGVPLDGPINRAATGDGIAALRLGPDEWLILADAERDPWLAARLEAAAEGAALSIVDVSHRTVGLVLAGPEVESVLAAGCALPLGPQAFPVGRATRTLLGRVEVILWRQEALRFRIEVARSLAPYVVAFLDGAIADEAAIAAAAPR